LSDVSFHWYRTNVNVKACFTLFFVCFCFDNPAFILTNIDSYYPFIKRINRAWIVVLHFSHSRSSIMSISKLEIKQGSYIQQTQYFIPVEIDLSVVPARLKESPRNGHVNIIGYQFGTKFKFVFCAKYDLGFWEILKPLKWTNITSFFLIWLKRSTKIVIVILVIIFQILIFPFIKAFLRLRL
jgi:hypothetical protein